MFALQPQLLLGKAHLRLVFIHIGRAGGIHQPPAGTQQRGRMAQQTALQPGEAVELVALPELEYLRVFFCGSPAGAGRVKQDCVPRAGA